MDARPPDITRCPVTGAAPAIDGRTREVTATIAVGRAPQGIAFDTGGGTAYVVNMNDNTVSVLGP
jgi:DNA-binding beta-propeller fold protein YncE